MVFKIFPCGLSLSQIIQSARLSVHSSELGPPQTPPPASECVSTLGPKRGKQHSPAGEGVGIPNSDDWTESLAFCILCGPDVWFGEATTTFVAGRPSQILTWMGTGPFQQRYVHKFLSEFLKIFNFSQREF